MRATPDYSGHPKCQSLADEEKDNEDHASAWCDLDGARQWHRLGLCRQWRRSVQLFTSVEAQKQQHSLAVGAQSPPLFTGGGVGVVCGLPWRRPITLLPTGISPRGTSGVRAESGAATTGTAAELSSQKLTKPADRAFVHQTFNAADRSPVKCIGPTSCSGPRFDCVSRLLRKTQDPRLHVATQRWWLS